MKSNKANMSMKLLITIVIIIIVLVASIMFMSTLKGEGLGIVNSGINSFWSLLTGN